MHYINLDNIFKTYQQKGFVVIKNFLKKKKINEIYKNLEKIENNLKKLRIRKRDLNLVNGKINSMHGLTKYNNYFKNFSKNRDILKVCGKLLASEPEFREAEYFAKPAKQGLESPMHQDNFYWNVIGGNALTMWFALEKSTKKNGGVKYIPKTHKLGVVSHVPSYAPGSSQKVSNRIIRKYNKYIIPKLNPGDVLIHHSEVIHGSGSNKSNKSRRGLTLQFKDKFSKYDYVAIKKYEKNLNKQIKKRLDKNN